MLLLEQDVYKVRGSVRGRAVIISCEYFTDSSFSARSGNSADVLNLKMLLQSLHFTVEIVDNKTDEVIDSNSLFVCYICVCRNTF